MSYPCGTIVKDVQGKRWIMLYSRLNGRRWEKLIEKFPYCRNSNGNCLGSSENYYVYEIHERVLKP